MKQLIFLFALQYILIINISNAASPISAQQFIKQKAFLFEENKGQLRDDNHRVLTDVKYYGNQGGVKVYCKSNMVSFVFTKIENEPDQYSEANGSLKQTQHFASLPKGIQLQRTSKITTSRMDLTLIGSNPNVNILATDQQEYYENFYTTGDANKGMPNVHTYKTITYHNIYPNIDMLLKCCEGNSMEYSFLVHPGGKVSEIKLRWNGMNKIEAKTECGYEFSNALGTMEESAPKSLTGGIPVKRSFVKKDGNYSFKLGEYDKTKDLLIDPLLTWATYFGGNFGESAKGVSTDGSGNVYIMGETESTSGLATSGAYQTTYGGGNYDVFLARFNTNGGLAWATYYGGSGDDDPSGITIDANGNLYITGYSQSSNGIATSGAHETSLVAGNDAFLAKFGSDGTLTWGTYYGSGNEIGTAVCTDVLGNVYLSGVGSDSGLATTGAYQTSFAGGIYDAFLVKFTGTGTVIWGTYFGGKGNDDANSVTTDALGNVYIAGSTNSDKGIATSGASQTGYGGGGTFNFGDAFLAKFSSNGTETWATYYGGFDDDDATSVVTDATGNVYITGSTYSNNMATSGAYQTSYALNGDAFIAKFNASGSLSWSTYYGGSDLDNGTGIKLDASGNIYISGTTFSTNGIATAGAYQTTIGGAGDAFLAIFNPDGMPSWATYFGGTGNESASSLSIDLDGSIYLIGSSRTQSGLATSGAYQASIPTGSVGASFLAKFGSKGSGISLESNEVAYNLNIYPNPFTDNATIKFNLPQNSNVKINIIDMMGNEVYILSNETLEQGPNEIELKALKTKLVPGTYFVNMTINGLAMTRKIIELK